MPCPRQCGSGLSRADTRARRAGGSRQWCSAALRGALASKTSNFVVNGLDTPSETLVPLDRCHEDPVVPGPIRVHEPPEPLQALDPRAELVEWSTVTSQCDMPLPVSSTRDRTTVLADCSATKVFFGLSVGLRQLCSGCGPSPMRAQLTLTGVKRPLSLANANGTKVCCSRHGGCTPRDSPGRRAALSLSGWVPLPPWRQASRSCFWIGCTRRALM